MRSHPQSAKKVFEHPPISLFATPHRTRPSRAYARARRALAPNMPPVPVDSSNYLATLSTIYGAAPEEGRYSPAQCMGARKAVINGDPVYQHVSTSYVERQNLTMRMGMRRFTRLTNGFSKKVENHECAIALHFMHYNFCRIHQTLRVTPAMEAGVADHVWSLEEIISLMD
jgi:hypothetical protein